MKDILQRVIDNTIKQRVIGSYLVYMFAKRIISAFENHDVAMEKNGEYWLLARISEKGAVAAIDVGANIGEWVTGLLEVAPESRVLCFEPVPTTYALLKKNVFAPSVTLLMQGLSSEPGDLTINSVVGNPLISSIYDVNYFQEGHEIQAVKIATSTGDAQIEAHGLEHIDIVKVDAEGHDLSVIQGFCHAINAGSVDFIQFEYNQFTLAARRSLRDFFVLLEPKYLVCRLLPNGLEACAYHPTLENFCQSNWVAVRREMLDEDIIKRFAIRPVGGAPGAVLAKSVIGDPQLAWLLGLHAAV